MRSWSEVLKNISFLSQLGLSLVMPLLLCLFVCYQLTVRASLGTWVYLPGFFFGLGGSFMTAYKLYRSVTAREGKGKREGELAFNRHH